MNWNNHGKLWHIDHIKPCHHFNLSDIEENIFIEKTNELYNDFINLLTEVKEDFLKKDVPAQDEKTETKEVESEWATGIVLALPSSYKEDELNIGDKVVYNKKFAKDFDLFKNSQLVKTYDIIAICK